MLHSELYLFALAALILVLSPGPNMIYLISRTLCHGRSAGLYSLLGVIIGFICHILLVAFGLTAILFAIPFAYFIIKWLGAIYLFYLAWNAFKNADFSPFKNTELTKEKPLKLFQMGLITNLLNPKVALFYMSFLPQFIRPDHGSIFSQSLFLGMVQLIISGTVNCMIVLFAAKCAEALKKRPRWLKFQRWFMGSILSYLGFKMALSENPMN